MGISRYPILATRFRQPLLLACSLDVQSRVNNSFMMRSSWHDPWSSVMGLQTGSAWGLPASGCWHCHRRWLKCTSSQQGQPMTSCRLYVFPHPLAKLIFMLNRSIGPIWLLCCDCLQASHWALRGKTEKHVSRQIRTVRATSWHTFVFRRPSNSSRATLCTPDGVRSVVVRPVWVSPRISAHCCDYRSTRHRTPGWV